MAANLTKPAKLETEIVKIVRDKLLQRLKSNELRSEELAATLGLLPSAADALLERTVWPVDLALRIAEAVKIDIATLGIETT